MKLLSSNIIGIDQLSIFYGINEYSNNSMLIFNIFLFLIASIFIIFLAFFTTKFISLRFNTTKNKNIKIVERLSLGVDRSLVIVKLGEIYYFLYMSKNKVELIDKIENLDISNDTNKKDNTFEEILTKLKRK